MKPKPVKPRQALNKAYLQVKPTRSQIEALKDNLFMLIEHTNTHESEEHHKNLVSDFLKKTWYDSHYFINTKERKDRLIHTGPKPDKAAVAIIEAKWPANNIEIRNIQIS